MTAKVARKARELQADATTAEEWRQFPRDNGKFMPGHHYGGGRTAGSRQKLSDAFIAVLHEDFEKHGAKAVVAVRREFPAAYVKVIASLLPRDVNLNLTAFDAMTDEQLDRRLQTIKAMIEVAADDRETQKALEIEQQKEEKTSHNPALLASSSVSD